MDVKLSDGPEAQGSGIAGVSAAGLAERDGREQARVRGTRRADLSQATREALIAAAHGLFDAPSVLGWERWREIGLRSGFGLVQATLQAAMEAGQIETQPVSPLAHLLLGAIDEGAMLVARASDEGETRAQVGASLGRFLGALRTKG